MAHAAAEPEPVAPEPTREQALAERRAKNEARAERLADREDEEREADDELRGRRLD